MIILTSDEADKVRGVSPTNARAALEPVPLKDGTFMLGDEVLSDPAHADVRDFLATLPATKDIDPSLKFQEEDAFPVTVKWADVGVRKQAAEAALAREGSEI